MLPWWGWAILWAVLVLGGALLIWVLFRRTWRAVRALNAELGRANALAVAIEREAATPNAEAPPAPRLAVFMAPSQVARERDAVRASLRKEKQERRQTRLPGWARPVDWDESP